MDAPEQQRVIVTDVQVPFVSLVVLLVKLAIAAIPAAIILSILGFLTLQAISNWNQSPDLRAPVAYAPPTSFEPSHDYIAPPALNQSPPRPAMTASEALVQAREYLSTGKAVLAYNAAHIGLNDPKITASQRRELEVLAEKALRER